MFIIRKYLSCKKIESNRNCLNRHYDYVNIFFYVTSLIVIVIVKIFYVRADNASLMLVIKPITKIVSIFHGSEFIFENSLGFFSDQLGIAINKSCAGVNFLLIIYCMLSFSYIHKFKTLKGKAIYFIAILPISYFLALLINSFRIIVSITMQRLNFLDGWASTEVIHNITGMLIFICFLFIVNYVFSTILKKDWCAYEEDT